MRTLKACAIALTSALIASGAWAQTMQDGTEASAAASAGPVEAAVALPLDGTWQIRDEVIGCCPAFFTDSFDWTSTDPVVVQVTDLFVVTDTYDIYDNGSYDWSTAPLPPAPNYDDLGVGAFDDPPWTNDPDVAWMRPVFSKGSKQYDPGSHSITILATQIPPGFSDSTVAIRAVAVPNCDIKPGSFPNSINLNKKKGVTPVALLGSENVDVTTIDVTTLMFEGAYPAHDLTDSYTYWDHIEDVNFDGYPDLVSHYSTPDLTGLHGGSTEGTIEGEIGGVPFSCSDSVRIIGG